MDSFSFRQSNARAAELVASGQGYFFKLEDGRLAVKLYRQSAMKSEAWQERFEEINESSNGQGLPNHELPGIYFQEPQSATWREQHRATRSWA